MNKYLNSTFFKNRVQIICLIYQKMLHDLLMLSIYSEYFSDTSLIFGAFSKNAQKNFFHRFYPICLQIISTRSSSNIFLYTHCLSMARIWARSETLSKIVHGCLTQSAVISYIVS